MKKDELMILKRELLEKYFKDLNPAQRKAVFTVKGPLLVLAGAGSGKTTVLVNRIANIILCGNAYESESVPTDKALVDEIKRLIKKGSKEEIKSFLPHLAVEPAKSDKILCITFTNKAANEFKERLNSLLGDTADAIWAGTFHSICVRILRRHIHLIGYDNSFTIYDADDTKKLITQTLKNLNIDEKLLPIRTVINAISRAKDKGILPEDFARESEQEIRTKKISEIYSEYQNSLRRFNALDFDDIIMLTNLLFESQPEILNKYREKFDYILVDEYQDTNPSQSRLITLLAEGKLNVCVVGDDDQSIYAFRGATVKNILSFDSIFKDAKVIRLEQNYRSTGNILNAANSLIKNNLGRKGKNLWTDASDGDLVSIKKIVTQNEESNYIAGKIKSWVSTGEYKFNDFAVLYRMNAQSNSLETSFSKNRIPYRVFGGIRFYERKEIKDIIAYLSVINNPNDDIRLKRIINVPRRGIGSCTLEAISNLSSQKNKSFFEIIKNSYDYPSLRKLNTRLENFYALIADLKDFSEQNNISELVKEVIIRTGYKEMIASEETDMTKAENLDEFVSSAIAFEESTENPTLSAFLEDVALVSDTDNFDNNANAVTLMTIHSAKGLEFPIVFLPGFEEGIFPSLQALGEGDTGLEEERRLAYVAFTRAKKKLYITHTNNRLLFGRTSSNPVSRFAEEIPDEYKNVETISQRPVFHAGDVRKKYTELSKESFIKNTSTIQNDGPQDFTKIKEGSRVSHPMFGKGVIRSAKKMGPDVLYEIEFDNGSKKRLMATYAKLKEIK